jgi:hypothetical protein
MVLQKYVDKLEVQLKSEKIVSTLLEDLWIFVQIFR